MDLRDYLGALKKDNELVSIRKPVSTKFEIASLTAQLDGREAVIFENVKESKMRVAANVCGTRKRFASAIDARQGSIHNRVFEALSRPKKPKTEAAKFNDNTSKDLSILPIVTHFEKDAGPFITSSIVFAREQESGNQNASVHRFLLMDEKHMAVRMVEGRHLHKCYQYAREHGEDLKAAVVVGVHPAVLIGAAYQAAYGEDEMEIANSLMNDTLCLTECTYAGLMVPSHAEIVLEGRILKDRFEEEWMVEMLRTYDHKRKQPVFELETLRYRNDAIYHDILPGYAEHRLLMSMPVEAKVLQGVKNVVPTTRQVCLTNGGCNWLHAVIQIKKRLEGESKNALVAAFAAHPSLKMAVVVDDDIDPADPESVEYAIATRFQADRDLIVIPNAKGSSLDPSSDQEKLLTTKVGIDATATLLKPRDRFEIANIPGNDRIKIDDYLC
ncbi:MAG: UbiD family decarboxylase [Nitrososphaerales archaeon]